MPNTKIPKTSLDTSGDNSGTPTWDEHGKESIVKMHLARSVNIAR